MNKEYDKNGKPWDLEQARACINELLKDFPKGKDKIGQCDTSFKKNSHNYGED